MPCLRTKTNFGKDQLTFIQNLSIMYVLIFFAVFVFCFGVIPILAFRRNWFPVLLLYIGIIGRFMPEDFFEYGIPFLLFPPVLFSSLLVSHILNEVIDEFKARRNAKRCLDLSIIKTIELSHLNTMTEIASCKIDWVPQTQNDWFETQETFITVNKDITDIHLLFMASMPEVDSVIVPFINRRQYMTDGDRTGIYLPSKTPSLLGFTFRYPELKKGDILRFVQCKALESGVTHLGEHRGTKYTGEVGEPIQEDQLCLRFMGYEQLTFAEGQ